MSEIDINAPGSLGSAFGGSAAGGLGGILAPRTSAPASPPAVAAPVPEPVPVERVAPDSVPEPLATADDRPEALEDDATYPVGVYLLPATIAAVSKRRKARRVENVNVALGAIDELCDELPALIAARRSAGRSSDSLFPPRRSESHQAAAARDGRRRLWSFQATAAEVRVIDRLVESTGARSRSELIACAMEAYLAPRRRGRAR
ncbi:ribbon-helix-helix protein, CopG family [Planobispora takensis]|uniref:Uncharacterized protein n=1 Tax=Planobispora takensis TaxID=1367882 RepID=A0A8J3X0H4_9ACTN|nr:ribbon-helix-helix protein, CopG family [Planobispora takensis]GII05752.1 hypothetical protein Pta02_77600 [Planobispora takensis]